MYILTKEKGNGIYYPNYLPDDVLEEGLRLGRLFKGTYHANQDNITEGKVNIHVNFCIIVIISRLLIMNTAC